MRLLHAGCGTEPRPHWFPADCDEVRLDADPACTPDILGTITDIGDIGPFDVIYCCHVLEHVYPHEVSTALEGFHRVLDNGGKCIIVVPDLQDVKPDETVLYESPGGPICGLDLYYGSSRMVAHNPYMAHHCGFTEPLLRNAMSMFPTVKTMRYGYHNLMAVGIK